MFNFCNLIERSRMLSETQCYLLIIEMLMLNVGLYGVAIQSLMTARRRHQ